MPLPNLIHAVKVVISRRATTSGVMDLRAKELVGATVRDEDFATYAQPHWNRNLRAQAVPGGTTEDSRGYLLFRFYDLVNLGLVDGEDPNPEVIMDMRVKQIGKRTGLNYFVVRVEDKAHYDEASLVKAWIEDRAPGNPPRSML